MENENVLKQIQTENDPDKLKDLTYLWNQNQLKKNIIKSEALDNLQDKVISNISDRLNKRPDNFTNKELLDSLQIIQNVKDKSDQRVAGIDESPVITHVNTTNIQVNMAEDPLSKESREKVLKAVDAILAKTKNIIQEVDCEE